MNVLKRHRGDRGVAAILVIGVLVVFLIFFLVVAIDFAYIYVVRGEMQNAADAGALAGASLLSVDSNDLVQSEAREAAIAITEKNFAAGSSVLVITDDSNTLGADNDITVGHWDGDTYAPDETPVNAVQVRTRRTENSPGGAVGLFFGRLLGDEWAAMDVSQDAIATRAPMEIGPMPLCLPTCDTVTPLTVVGQNKTPGSRFFFKKSDAESAGSSLFIGWSSFLDKSTSKPSVEAYLKGEKTPPPICEKCIFTTEGLVHPLMCVVRQRIYDSKAIHEVNGVNIEGWKLAIPILLNTPCPTAKGTGCITGDPGYQPGDPYEVIRYSQIIITDAIPQGNCPGDPTGDYAPGPPGIVIVGTGPGVQGVNSTIQCLDCNDPDALGLDLGAKLVE